MWSTLATLGEIFGILIIVAVILALAGAYLLSFFGNDDDRMGHT